MKQPLLSFLFIASCGMIQAQATHCVKATVTGKGTGTDWDNASGDLQTIINEAVSGDSIFISGGTYQPASGQYFSMKQGVRIYGGFAGTETSLAERDLSIGDTSILLGNGNSVIPI